MCLPASMWARRPVHAPVRCAHGDEHSLASFGGGSDPASARAVDAIKGSEGESTKLTFFRGPTAFLYGPTKPAAEWYQENLALSARATGLV